MSPAINASQAEGSVVTTPASWTIAYRVGAVAAILSVVSIPFQIGVYLIAPPPATALGYFQLFQQNWWLGLISTDLFYLLTNLVLLATLPALCVALWRFNPTLTSLGALLGLVGIVALIVARPSLELATLSRQYAAAESEAQRAGYLAVGELLVATINGTAYQLHLILGSLGFLLLSVVMLSSPAFGKAIGYIGIAANAVTLGYWLPVVGVYLLLLSVLFFAIWYVLMARAFLRMK